MGKPKILPYDYFGVVQTSWKPKGGHNCSVVTHDGHYASHKLSYIKAFSVCDVLILSQTLFEVSLQLDQMI